MKTLLITDVDGVILNLMREVVFLCRYKYDIHVDEADILHYELTDSLGITKEQSRALIEDAWNEPLFAYRGAEDFLAALKVAGVDVHGLSMRPPWRAQKAAHRDFPEYFGKNYTLVDRLADKAVAIKDLVKGYDYTFYLDDKVETAVNIHNRYFLTTTMLMDRSWNRSADVAGYTRVKGYLGVLRTIFDVIS
jgi:hypothetical protein